MKGFKVFMIVLLLANAGLSQAASRLEFDQLVTQLQAKPADNALRERVIKMSLELKPAPAVPEVARAAYVEGLTITKSASDAAQQKLAVQSYQEALKLAPWWGEAYYNLAVAQELAGQFEGAKASLKFYILTNPSDKEAREAQDRIYALNAKIKMAAVKKPGAVSSGVGAKGKGSANAQAADDAKAAAARQESLASLEGIVWMPSRVSEYPGVCADSACSATTTMYRWEGFTVRSGQFVIYQVQWRDGESQPPVNSGQLDWSAMPAIAVTGRRLSTRVDTTYDPNCRTWTFDISDDNAKVTRTYSCAEGLVPGGGMTKYPMPPQEFKRAN